jgi:hypothetical protein
MYAPVGARYRIWRALELLHNDGTAQSALCSLASFDSKDVYRIDWVISRYR